MDIDKMLKVLPDIAREPLAIAAYVAVVAVWALLAAKRSNAKTFLKGLKAARDQKDFVNNSGYKYDDIAQLPEGERLPYLTRRYLLVAWLGTIFAVLVFAYIWFTHAKKVALLQQRLEAIVAQSAAVETELAKRDKLERLFLINSAGVTNELTMNQDEAVKKAAAKLSALLLDLANLQNEDAFSAEEKVVIRIAKADVALAEKKYDEVLSAISEQDVQHSLARATHLLKLRGDAFYGQAKWQDALNTYNMLLSHDSKNWQSMLRTANCLLLSGKEGEAVDKYTSFCKAISNAEHADAYLRCLIVASHNNCGNAQYALKDYSAAITEYTEALRLMRDNPDAVREKSFEIATIVANRAHAYGVIKREVESAADYAEAEQLIAGLRDEQKSRPDVIEFVKWLKTAGKRLEPQQDTENPRTKHKNKGCFNCHPATS